LIRSREFVEERRLRLGQRAFPRNPLMLFICTFDVVFIFAAVVRELFNHFIDAAGHIAIDCRLEHYALTDMEFMRRHRGDFQSRFGAEATPRPAAGNDGPGLATTRRAGRVMTKLP
jgi:hypothetical protein